MVGFLRSSFILAVLKDTGIRPEVREELIRALGKAGCRSMRPAGVRRGWGQGAGDGVLRRNYSIDVFRGERDKVGRNRGGDGVREDCGKGQRGADFLHRVK